MLKQILEALEDAKYWDLAAAHESIFGDPEAARALRETAANQRFVASCLAVMVAAAWRRDRDAGGADEGGAAGGE